MNAVVKWLFWVCGVAAVSLGMDVVVAGTVARQVGICAQGLFLMFGSAALFSAGRRFDLRRVRRGALAGARQGRSRRLARQRFTRRMASSL